MTIENLKQSLIQQGSSEAKRLLAEAQKQADEILHSAKEKAAAISSESKKKTDAMISAQRNEKISAAKLRAKKMVSEARDEIVEVALGRIWDGLCELPKGENYEKIMKEFIVNGSRELGKGAIVQVNSRDAKLAKKFHDNLHPQAANITGGAIIMNGDKNIFVDNSLESLYKSKKEALRTVIYSELFEGKT